MMESFRIPVPDGTTVVVDFPERAGRTPAQVEAEQAAALDTIDDEMVVYRARYATLVERRPRGSGWRRIPVDNGLSTTLCQSGWRNGSICAISSLIIADLPDRSGRGPQWLVSVSREGRRRPKPHQLRRALRAFGMEEAECDQHHPGIARHYFLAVEPEHRSDCECKADEEVIVEPDGYRWTTPKGSRDNPAICRGCELERLTRRTCSLHGGG